MPRKSKHYPKREISKEEFEKADKILRAILPKLINKPNA